MTCSLFVKVNNIDIPSGSRRAPKRLVATVEALCPRLQANSVGATLLFAEKEEQGSGRMFFLQRKTEQSELCSDVAPQVGLEPTTLRLTAACSTD